MISTFCSLEPSQHYFAVEAFFFLFCAILYLEQRFNSFDLVKLQIIGGSLLLLAGGRPHLLGGLGPGGALALPQDLLLVHLLGVVDIDVRPLLLRDHALLLLVVVQDHAQVLQDRRRDLVLEVLDGRGHDVEVHLQDVVLPVPRVFVPAGDCEPPLAAERVLEAQRRAGIGLGVSVLLDDHPVIEAFVELEAVLDGGNFVDGDEVLDDHVDEFELADDGAVLLLQLLPLLHHELLDVIVGLVGELQLVVDFGELLAAVLYLLLQGEVLLCVVLDVDVLLVDLFLEPALLLLALLELLLRLEDLLLVDPGLLLELVAVQQLLLHLLQPQRQLLLFQLLLLLLLVRQLLLQLQLLLLLQVLPQDLVLLLLDLLLLLLQPRRDVLRLLLHLLLHHHPALHRQLSLQHLLQLLDLRLILADHRVFWVLIDLRLVLDLLGFRGVPQRAHRLLVVVVRRAHIGDHDRLRVASQRLLQQSCELGVTVGNMGSIAAHEGLDDLSERGEGQVDVDAFLRPAARGLRLLLALGACEVDQVELAGLDLGLAVDDLFLLDPDHEDAVRAGGILVHLGRADVPVLAADEELLIHVGDGLDHLRAEVFDVDALVLVLVDLQLVGLLGEEVDDLLVVKLEHGDLDQELRAGRAVDGLDDVLKGARDDALLLLVLLQPLHRVRLPRPRLPVGEDGAVVPLQHALDDRQRRLLEDPLLQTARLEGEVEAEHALLLARVLRAVHHDLAPLRKHVHDRLVLMLQLPRGQWPAPHCHLHALALCHSRFKYSERTNHIHNYCNYCNGKAIRKLSSPSSSLSPLPPPHNNFIMEGILEVQEKRERAADRIQKLWRSYTNRKIYKYYKDIIMFKCKGNPAKLLKGINPLEAQLLETAVDCHVRFRLGGDTFPPNIYYKVFSKANVCDINAFAPRDYSSLPREAGEEKIKFSTYQRNRKEYESEGWYLRADNNGWRPISHKMFIKTDYVELYSAKKVNFYHHKKELRDEKYFKKQRLAKLKWLKNLYLRGKQPQEAQLVDQLHRAEEAGEGTQLARALNSDPALVDAKLNDRQFDAESEEMDDLLEWTENLNFDAYVRDWYQLSTSESSKDFVPKFVNSLEFNVLI